MSNFLIRKFKDLNSKQKFYLGIALLLYLSQFFFLKGGKYMNYINTSSEYIVMFSIIGLTFALIRRRNSRKSIDDKSLISILSNDYNLYLCYYAAYIYYI